MAVLVDLAAMSVPVLVPAGVSARLGLEGRDDAAHLRTQLLKHILENVVGRDAQESGADLHCHVPIAEVVGRAGKLARRAALDVHEAFKLCNDRNDTSIRSRDQVAAAQHLAARQQDGNRFARRQLGVKAGFLALLERQRELSGGTRDSVSAAAGRRFSKFKDDRAAAPRDDIGQFVLGLQLQY